MGSLVMFDYMCAWLCVCFNTSIYSHSFAALSSFQLLTLLKTSLSPHLVHNNPLTTNRIHHSHLHQSSRTPRTHQWRGSITRTTFVDTTILRYDASCTQTNRYYHTIITPPNSNSHTTTTHHTTQTTPLDNTLRHIISFLLWFRFITIDSNFIGQYHLLLTSTLFFLITFHVILHKSWCLRHNNDCHRQSTLRRIAHSCIGENGPTSHDESNVPW